MVLRTNYVTGEPDPAGALNTSNAKINSVEPRTGVKAVGQNELVFNVADFGAVDGADISAAITAAIDAMPTTGSSGTSILQFPAGQFNTAPFATPSGKTIVIRGAGQNITEIRPVSGSTTGDLITIRGAHSTVQDLTINGRVAVTASLGDALVIDAPYVRVDRVRVQDVKGNGVSIGKGASAIGWILGSLQVRNSWGYGVRVYGTYVSTDGSWLYGDVGQTGLSGVRLDAASENLVNVHAWGAGAHSTTDNHGFLINSRGNLLSNCQAETCMGDGIRVDGGVDGQHTQITGGRFWGNVGAGIRIQTSNKNAITGVSVNRNGVGNTGANQTQWSGIVVSASLDTSVTGSVAWDANTSIDANAGPTAAEYTYPGKDGSVLTQVYGVVSTGSGNRTSLVGNNFRNESHRSGVGVSWSGSNDVDSIEYGNYLGATPTKQIASAASLTIPPGGNVVQITGTTQVTSIAVPGGDRRVTLVFTASTPAGIAAGATNTRMSGAFVPTQGGAITFATLNGIWYETARVS